MGAGASSKKYETVADEWAALFAEAVAKEQALRNADPSTHGLNIRPSSQLQTNAKKEMEALLASMEVDTPSKTNGTEAPPSAPTNAASTNPAPINVGASVPDLSSPGTVAALERTVDILLRMSQKENDPRKWTSANQNALHRAVTNNNATPSILEYLLNTDAFRRLSGMTKIEYATSLEQHGIKLGNIGQIVTVGATKDTPIPGNATVGPTLRQPTTTTSPTVTQNYNSLLQISSNEANARNAQAIVHFHFQSDSFKNLVGDAGIMTRSRNTGQFIEGICRLFKMLIDGAGAEGLYDSNSPLTILMMECMMELLGSHSEGELAKSKAKDGIGDRQFVSDTAPQTSKDLNANAMMVTMRWMYILKLTTPGAFHLEDMIEWACSTADELPSNIIEHANFKNLYDALLAKPIPVLIIGGAARRNWERHFSRPTATSSSSFQPFSSYWWCCVPMFCVHLWGLFQNSPFQITKEQVKGISDSIVTVLGNFLFFLFFH